jgi:hypothetical protein
VELLANLLEMLLLLMAPVKVQLTGSEDHLAMNSHWPCPGARNSASARLSPGAERDTSTAYLEGCLVAPA